jgi:predicted Rossmann fold nucleotide-binding protein DprA/Smf involved in DNA uptake
LEEAAVLKCVTEEGVSIDGIVVKSAFAAAKVSSLLAGLRLKGRICFMPGNRVRLAQLTDRAQI